MTDVPKFSVVIPTYNRAPILEKFLKALAAQTYPDFEAVVVDDGSTDNTQSVARRYPFVRYIRVEHEGSAKLLNIGWRASEGEFILMTDDDCIGPPNWLSSLADGLRRYPEAVAVGCYAGPPEYLMASNRFARYEEWEWRFYGGGFREYVGGAETPTAGLVAYRRKALEEVGGFNEGLVMEGAHDHDIKQRLTSRGHKLVYLPLKIDHHRPYTARSFRRQHMGRGRAVVRYAIATDGRPPGYLRIFMRTVKQTLLLFKHLVVVSDKRLAFTIFESRFANCVGQWRERTALRAAR